MNVRDFREKLIEEVRRCPALYDARHDQHRDMDARDRCWADIAARLGGNSEGLKREWKILRDSLRQSLKKSRATTKAGVPCKKWRFHARMAFLLPHMTRRNTRRVALRDDVKLDLEPEASEPEEWAPPAPPGPAPADDALELFFASVCASARRLPAAQQRALKRCVLDALLRCETQAEPSHTPPPPESSTGEMHEHFK